MTASYGILLKLLIFRVFEIYGVGYRTVQTTVHSNSTACSMMQYARHCTTTEDCAMSIRTVLFYSTADCYNTVHVRYGQVEQRKYSKAQMAERTYECLSFIAISDTV